MGPTLTVSLAAKSGVLKPILSVRLGRLIWSAFADASMDAHVTRSSRGERCSPNITNRRIVPTPVRKYIVLEEILYTHAESIPTMPIQSSGEIESAG
jgi:hypothetical protein